MLDLIEKVRNTLIADSTMQGYIDERVYMAFKPVVMNRRNDYPQVTIRVDDGDTYNFLDVYQSDLYIDIWNKESNGGQTRCGEILKRILQLLDHNRFDTDSDSYKVYWFHKDYTNQFHEEDTHIYRVQLKMTAICEAD